jgi:uncharacterized membrane protein (DUF106 family)
MADDISTLLQDISEGQRLQAEHGARSLQLQVEALALQRQQFELYQQQLARVERINDRAEAIQDRAGRAMRLVLWVLLPLLLAIALVAVLWPWLRYWTGIAT